MTKKYPEIIQEELERVEDETKRVLELIPAANLCNKVASAFPHMEDIRTSVRVGGGVLNGALFMVDVDKLQDISPILRYFAKQGWRINGEPDDYEEVQRRTWELSSEEHPGRIQVSAFFKGETCKFVKVGTKQEPVYELKCEPGELNI